MLTAELDREVTRVYTLMIAAQDGGIPRREANMTLLLEVLDSNDNVPVFEKNEYEAVLDEDAPLMTTVVEVRKILKS